MQMEKTVDRWREICAAFRWEVPADFNVSHHACHRWAADEGRVAIYWEDEGGEARRVTFRELSQAANRLSNALAHLGVQRGDRVALILPQRPETAIAHLAVYKLGAVAVPLFVQFGPEALEHRLADSGARALDARLTRGEKQIALEYLERRITERIPAPYITGEA